MNALGKEWMSPGNLVVMVSAPEKENVSVPSSADLADIMERVGDETIEPYADTVGG